MTRAEFWGSTRIEIGWKFKGMFPSTNVDLTGLEDSMAALEKKADGK